MKDKISFESSVREKRELLTAKIKRRRKNISYAASTLCACFIVAFGVYITLLGLRFDTMEKAAAPDSAADIYYSYSTELGASGGGEKFNQNSDKVNAESASADNAATPAKTEVQKPYEPSTPITSTVAPSTMAPTTTSVPQIYPERPKGTAEYLKGCASSVSIYTSEIAKNTRSTEEIHEIINVIFSKNELVTEPDGTNTVKIVFSAVGEKYTFFVSEDDIANFIP